VYTEGVESQMLIQRNVPVAVRDGTTLFIDIYRPAGSTAQRDRPILLGWSPYGKHNTSSQLPWPEADVRAGWISQYTAFEAPDPQYWCRHGYAVAYADPRGSWYSAGELRHGGAGEAEDCYDLIAWLGQQPWSNGRVGMTGVSYLTAIQWQVAPLQPPFLAAINPWEGFSDWYREFAYHGGIRETSFLERGCANLQWSTTRTEDTAANARAHPLHDAYWQAKECDLESIQAPAYVVASWADQGLHTRGTIEAYRRIGSSQKWLQVHGRKKWHYYYRPESVERQREFFDHFLIRPGTTVPAWPPVLLEVRETAEIGTWRAHRQWPPEGTEYRKLYLNAPAQRSGSSRVSAPRQRGRLLEHPTLEEAEIRYSAESPDGQAIFDYSFTESTELTGYCSLRLWVEADGSDDMDLFVGLQKLDTEGRPVPFIFYAMHENGPVALGWLRVSHRALDLARSRPEFPVHLHTHEERLIGGERVPVEIEIWPSSTSFQAGESLRLIIQGRDIPGPTAANSPFARHLETRNRGVHVLHMGGVFDSYLLVPAVRL
jgi:predicted acyl esterase